jgi:hypothetical protein
VVKVDRFIFRLIILIPLFLYGLIVTIIAIITGKKFMKDDEGFL